MSNIAIKVENLSKAYQLGQIGTGTISRDLERWFARIRGKEDPFLRIGESNDQNTKSTNDVVWSLKDINFEIEQGDAVGIIGRNGAGKSTLLKILSKVTAPTTGKISGRGRIASLLEVGTGFHPELSGRENIFLNGAILGMRKKEIQRKLDEIVDFAGIERYLDTPVKRYSSGMYVRLAFAVAAHLESEILIVDEVLAVGDAEFQKKCLGKMGEISKGQGKTVLFVSHNMDTIKKICKTGITLSKGEISTLGPINECIQSYLSQTKINSSASFKLDLNKEASVSYVELRNSKNEMTSEINIYEGWKIIYEFEVLQRCNGLICGLGVTNMYNVSITTTWHEPLNLEPGTYRAEFTENQTFMALGGYNIHIGLSLGNIGVQFIEDAIKFEVVHGSNLIPNHKLRFDSEIAVIINEMNSKIIKIG